MRSTTPPIIRPLMIFALALGAFAAAPVLADTVATPAGTGIEIYPLPELTVVFDQVTAPGETDATRTDLGVGGRLTPCGNTIPSFVELPGDADHFIVYRIETTASFTDSIEVILDDFGDSDRLFHASCPPDEAGFRNVTTLAIPGDPRARIPKFSEFVVGVDTRDFNHLLTAQIGVLREILGVGSPEALALKDHVLSDLRNYANEIILARMAGDYQRAYEQAGGLILYVRDNSGETIPNRADMKGGNTAGELISATAAVKFTLRGAF